MSEPRTSARCIDCDDFWNGTAALEWAAEHLDLLPDHRIIWTKTGSLETHESRPTPDA